MLLRLSILVIAYVGVRLFENYQKKHKEPDDNSNVTSAQNPQDVIKEPIINETEKEQEYYLKMSAISLGLVAIKNTFPSLRFLSFAMLIYTSLPILKWGEKQIREPKIGHDVLFSTLIFLCFATGQGLALAISIFFYYVGLKVLASNQKVSQQIITNLFERQPNQVWVLKEGIEVEMPLSAVQVNDIVVINAGEVVPIDGIITDGMAMIDQHALTGESMPVEKEIGTQVLASTLVVRGKIWVKVEKAGFDTTVHKIGEILSCTAEFKTSLQLKGEEWADKIALPILTLALLATPPLGLLGAATVVNSGFGNRLRVLAPFGTLNHLNLAYRKGILIKDGRVLEELKKVDTVLFDKTGTLTNEQPIVGRITVCDDYGEDEILTCAAAAERKLAHPIAQAIINKAQDFNLTLPEIEDAKYQMGYGITVNLANQIIQVGSTRFMTMEGIAIPVKIEQAQQHSHSQGYSLVIVAINHQVAGAIEIQPQVRAEVKNVISGLRQRGIKLMVIVSGDNKQPTQNLAEFLGMDNYFYEVLPQKKAEIVEQLQKEGKRVCFVGDGINDAIAMKKANVSISLCGASSLATDIAQVVLMDGSLSHLCELVDISNNLEVNLQRTFMIIGIPSVFNLGGALFASFGIIGSMILVNISFLLALGNTMLPLRQTDSTTD